MIRNKQRGAYVFLFNERNYMNSENYKVLSKIIGAVETGSQIYGNAKYDTYVPPYTNTDKEHTITLGWPCFYGESAKKLIKSILDKDHVLLRKLDVCSPSIESMLSTDWESTRWNPSSAQKNVLIKLISSDIGKECQDELFAEDMKKFVADCENDYTKDIGAIMMYAEIEHLGGKDPVDRIFRRCNGNYSLDNILDSLKKDQSDTSSSNQVGDQKYWSRHQKCVEFIKKYAVPEDGNGNEAEHMGFKKYNLSESQLKQIARLCQQEQGTVTGAKAEASLMANQLETSKTRQNKYGTGANGLYNWVRNGGWFSRAAYWMDNGDLTNSVLEGVRDVLVNANRTLPLYVDEHDCLSDIKSISTGNVRDKSAYIQGKTIIKNDYGSTWTFWCFPDAYSDPFGYTAEAYKAAKELDPGKEDEKIVSPVEQVLAIAEAEVGYLEKASNKDLDSKTGNAGSNNYTKYARDCFPSLQPDKWCAMFVDWCLVKAFGKATANKMVNGLSADCDEVAANYKSAGRFFKSPKAGDQILFLKNGNDYYHTGIVYKVTDSTVYTIEGNTNAGSSVIPNGGSVCKKSYSLSESKIGGYGRPNYDLAPSKKEPETKLNETSKWTGYVTTDSLNVRKWAGTENDLCSFSPLSYQTAVGVCDEVKASNGNKWYYILYNGKHGFVSSNYISKTKPKDKSSDGTKLTESQSKFLAANQKVCDTARLEKWSYGDSHALPPCADKTISCDRMPARALWDLGFTDQRTGGEVCTTLPTWLTAHGWKQVSKDAIKPGAIVAVRYSNHSYIDHVFVVESYNPKTGICNKYDCGSNERIRSKQPFKNVPLMEWSGRLFVAAWNVPDSLDPKPEPTPEPDPKSDTVYNGVDYQPVYNYTYYKKKYKDLRDAFGTDKKAYFDHFCKFGMKEGRQAASAFDVQKYKARYEDLRKQFGDNLPEYYKHYCVYGKKEGRKAN